MLKLDFLKKNKKEKEAQAAREAAREAERQRKEEEKRKLTEAQAKIDEHARGGKRILDALRNIDIENIEMLAEQKESKLSVETVRDYARAIENILEHNHCEYALSDKFGDEKLIQSELMKNGRNIHLEQMCKAESDIAVAAASVLARATFVEKMQAMEATYGLKFQKGCSGLVKNVAAEFIAKYGKDRLKEVCKAHFKTYNEV